MDRMADALASPAGVAGLVAALAWAPATGIPTWPALARGRLASTVVISLAVGASVFLFARRLAAPSAG
jgi:hypothetical protein